MIGAAVSLTEGEASCAISDILIYLIWVAIGIKLTFLSSKFMLLETQKKKNSFATQPSFGLSIMTCELKKKIKISTKIIYNPNHISCHFIYLSTFFFFIVF
jgi:hypothetical protein